MKRDSMGQPAENFCMRRVTSPQFPVLISFALLLLATAPESARAQGAVETTPVLAAGDTVRVWATNPRLEGAMGLFSRIDSRQLVMNGATQNPGTPGREVAIPLDPMPRIE